MWYTIEKFKFIKLKKVSVVISPKIISKILKRHCLKKYFIAFIIFTQVSNFRAENWGYSVKQYFISVREIPFVGIKNLHLMDLLILRYVLQTICKTEKNKYYISLVPIKEIKSICIFLDWIFHVSRGLLEIPQVNREK